MRISNRLRFITLGIAAAVLAAAVVSVSTPPAYAHASLIRANPGNNETLRRPPLRVTLNFSEGVEQRLTSIQVLDGKDKKTRVDSDDLAFDNADPTFASIGLRTLDPGLYYVKWSNVSAVDGHDLAGQYPFIILNSDGSFPVGVTLDSGTSSTSGGQLLPRNLDSALKWIALLSLATVAGAALFLLVVLRPAAAFLEDKDYHAATDAAERWVVNLAHVLLPASFIALAFLILLTVHRFETSTSLWQYLTTVRTGEYRFALLGLLVVGLAGGDLLFLGRNARMRNIGLGVLLVACTGALFTYSMISHAATGQGKFWSVTSDFLHLVASAAWLGALAMLLPFLLWRRRTPKPEAPSDDEEAARFLYMANVLDRFSVVAAISVVVIFATGTFNGLADIPNPGAMIRTTYGKVLLAKLSLLAPLLALAGLNAFYFKPRLVALVDGLYQRGGSASESQRGIWKRRLSSMQRMLPWTVAGEIALVLAVFGAVGVLTQTSTAKGEEAYRTAQTTGASKFEQSATQDSFKLSLQVTPNRVGVNEYDLVIQNAADGTPLTTVTLARLRFTYTDAPNAVAGSEITLNRFAPGEYKGAGSYFTQSGNWRVDATVRRSDGDDVNHAYILPVNPAQNASSTKGGGTFALPFTVFGWNEVLAGMLAIGGALLLLYRRPIGELRPWAYRADVTAATLVLLTSATLAFGVHTHSNVGNLTKGNQVKPTVDSVARGKELFQQNCVQCHGIGGSGDGPEAPNLNPAPTDFRLHMPLHTDPQFFAFIADGYAGSQMPAFKSAFSDTDIWNLVNYLRSAFSGPVSQ